MKIVLCASAECLQELKGMPGMQECRILESHPAKLNASDADIYLNLMEDAAGQSYGDIQIPVFIHSVNDTLKKNHLPPQVVRINAWPGFMQRPVWEYAGALSEQHQALLDLLGKKGMAVADQPGLVAARILALIINEACYAEQEGVSSVKDIDIAMTLGTNYPAGPFEWAERIGWKRVHGLLQELSFTDERYIPAAGMVTRITS